MHAIQITEPGGPEVMKWTELPTPEPAPGEILVRIEAAGVNFIDVYFRKGTYKMPLPAVLGAEAAGVVEKVGPGVTTVRPAIASRGPIEWAVLAPAGLRNPRGRSCGARGDLAGVDRRAASGRGHAPGDDRPLLESFDLRAASRAHVSRACRSGWRGVVALSDGQDGGGARDWHRVHRRERRRSRAGAGADEVILYTQQDFEAETRRLTGGARSRCRLRFGRQDDVRQEPRLARACAACSPLRAGSSGPVPPFDPAVLSAKGSLFLTRPTSVHYVATRDELVARAREVLSWVASGALKVRIGATFPLRGRCPGAPSPRRPRDDGQGAALAVVLLY